MLRLPEHGGPPPPFRLESTDDVRQYASALATYSVGFEDLDWFARNHRVSQPSLLQKLPRNIDLIAPSPPPVLPTETAFVFTEADDPLFAIARRHVELARDAADSYTEQVHREVARVHQALGTPQRESERADDAESGKRAEADEQPEALRFLVSLRRRHETVSELPQLLGLLVKRILSTRNPSLVEVFTDVVYRLLQYTPGDADARGETIAALDSSTAAAGMIDALHRMHVVRLGNLRQIFLRESEVAFLEAVRTQVRRLKMPANARSTLLHEVERLFSAVQRPAVQPSASGRLPATARPPTASPQPTTTDARQDYSAQKQDALVRVSRIVSAYRTSGAIPEETLVRIDGIMRNYAEKLVYLEDLYHEHFHVAAVEDAYRRLSIARAERRAKEGAPPRASLPRILDDGVRAYPCKDYLDYWKGHVSGDCTAWPPLNRSHMLSPAFLNLRLFSGRVWWGNIYLLDYSERDSLVVVDRIQVWRETPGLNLQRLNRVMRAIQTVVLPLLAKHAGGTVLVARQTSNTAAVRDYWKAAFAGTPLMSYALSAGESTFESVSSDFWPFRLTT